MTVSVNHNMTTEKFMELSSSTLPHDKSYVNAWKRLTNLKMQLLWREHLCDAEVNSKSRGLSLVISSDCTARMYSMAGRVAITLEQNGSQVSWVAEQGSRFGLGLQSIDCSLNLAELMVQTLSDVLDGGDTLEPDSNVSIV